MDKESADGQASTTTQAVDGQSHAASDTTTNESVQDGPSSLSAAGISSWARVLKIPQPLSSPQDDSPTGDGAKSSFARFTSGIGLRLSPKSPPADDIVPAEALSPQTGFLGTITKGFLDSSKNAVKAVQVKARHVVSQNKRRYQEGGFDLDMTYITENIIAMGFPAGDMSSGFFGYVEGFYRNHMEEVIKFFETHHKGKYKVYNLCSERLYDASLFEGKVACFPFDDHNCPPIQLITSFCQSAYAWLKEDIENVVVVHCKAGMARTGLMISSLLLYLKFFPTAEESMSYYNQKRCVDAKGLVLPSQIRYVKYFESILTYFNGENQPGRRCMLRGFRLHKCPYWIRPVITISDHNGVLFSTKKHSRTKDLSTEDFWFAAPKKGIMVFALPGEPGLSELCGDFKVQFHDRQGDFYCWLNTTFIENRKILNTNELDGFDKRKLPSPGFQVEIVLADYDGSAPSRPNSETAASQNQPSGVSQIAPLLPSTNLAATDTSQESSDSNNDKDDVFSDDEGGGDSSSSKGGKESLSPIPATTNTRTTSSLINTTHNSPPGGGGGDAVDKLPEATQTLSIESSGRGGPNKTETASSSSSLSGGTVTASPESQFKAMAADASVFSFGDDDDYESD